MASDLYEADILEWSEQQAALLRRAGAGERVNGIDWENVAEEVESVGRSEWRACESLLLQALRHLLKRIGWPDNMAAHHWEAEVVAFLPQARQTFSPSMRRLISLDAIYGQALASIRRERMEGGSAAGLPETCPVTLDDLLAEPIDLDMLMSVFVAARSDGDA